MSANKYLQQATGAFQPVSWTDISTSASAPSTNWALTNISNTLGSSVTSTSTSVFTTVGTVSQGTAGVWLCIGYCAVYAGGAVAGFDLKITDGTTIWGSQFGADNGNGTQASCFAVATSPTTNLKLQLLPRSAVAAFSIYPNLSGGGKDSGLTVVRIG